MLLIKKLFRSVLLLYTEYISNSFYVKRLFKERNGYSLDMKNPKTHSEKTVCRTIRYTEDMVRLSDKVAVREYVKEVIGEEYLVPAYAIIDSLTQENYDALPMEFVIKGNHGSGFNLIVRNKDDYPFQKLKKITDEWLKTKFYMQHMEFHYKKIRPQLIVEKLLLEENGDVPSDFKCNFFDNNGDPVIIISVMTGRFSDLRIDAFDSKWNNLDITLNRPRSDVPSAITRPKTLNEMIECTKKIASPYAYTRVDFYEVDGQLYFGEITFTPAAGRNNFESSQVEMEWGELWGTQKIQ